MADKKQKKDLSLLRSLLLIVGAIAVVFLIPLAGMIKDSDWYETNFNQKPKETVAAETQINSGNISVDELYNLTNAERAKAGSPAVRLVPTLTASSKERCDDMVAKNYFDHTSPTGEHSYESIQRHTYYDLAGENIASGYNSAQEVIQAWLNSPSHKEAMLEPRYTAIGFSVCKSESFVNRGPALVVVEHLIKEIEQEARQYNKAPSVQSDSAVPPRLVELTTVPFADISFGSCNESVKQQAQDDYAANVQHANYYYEQNMSIIAKFYNNDQSMKDTIIQGRDNAYALAQARMDGALLKAGC